MRVLVKRNGLSTRLRLDSNEIANQKESLPGNQGPRENHYREVLAAAERHTRCYLSGPCGNGRNVEQASGIFQYSSITPESSMVPRTTMGNITFQARSCSKGTMPPSSRLSTTLCCCPGLPRA